MEAARLECGQGSSGRTISRPWSESVQRCFARTGVADVGSGAVADEPPLAVELVRPQLLALGAEPVVVVAS